MEFKYTEITMRLTRVVNGDHLVETLDWLALCSTQRYIVC